MTVCEDGLTIEKDVNLPRECNCGLLVHHRPVGGFDGWSLVLVSLTGTCLRKYDTLRRVIHMLNANQCFCGKRIRRIFFWPTMAISLLSFVSRASAGAEEATTPNDDDIYWTSLGSGLNGPAFTMLVFQNQLIVGGGFTEAGGVSANRIALWDGSSWSPLGTGMNDQVYALAVYNNRLVAGGLFTTAGEATANRLAVWDGEAWSAMGSGMDERIWTLTTWNAGLVAAGWFTTAGGNGANRVAVWNGSSWAALGTGLDNWVEDALAFGGNLFVGGWFSSAGGAAANRIASWDGSSWSALGAGFVGSTAHIITLASFNNQLIVGGSFSAAGGTPASHVATWDGSSWSSLGSGMTGASVSVLAVSNNLLYAGGYFTDAGGAPAENIAAWDGATWSALGSGTNNPVWAMTTFDGALIAGGLFTGAGGKSMMHVAQWKKPCCQGRVGDANGLGTYPLEVTIGDIQTLITAKFIMGTCDGIISCLAEGDVNQSGGVTPTCGDITISDIQTQVNHLFIQGPANAPLADCPEVDEMFRIPHGSGITVDGQLQPAEWSDASTVTLSIDGIVDVTVMIKHDGANLLSAYSYSYIGQPGLCMPEIFIDTDNDKNANWQTDDWWFHVSASDCEARGTYGVYNDCSVVQPDWQAVPNFPMTPNPPPLDTFEVSIPLAKLGVGTGSTVGIAFRVEWVPTMFGYWPSSASPDSPATWGTALIEP